MSSFIENATGDLKEFLKSTYNRRVSIYRNVSLSDMGIDDVDILSVLNIRGADPSFYRVVNSGSSVPYEYWTRDWNVRVGRYIRGVDPLALREQLTVGSTIAVDSCELLMPGLDDVVQSIQDIFVARASITMFATPRRQEGFNPHRDGVHVFVVQIDGSKRWWLWPSQRSDLAGSSVEYDPSDLGDPEVCVDLEPGDVLYMPYGTPHCAAALDKGSVHLSVAFKQHTLASSLKMVSEAAVEHHKLKTPIDFRSGRTFPKMAKEFPELFKTISSWLEQEDFGALGATAKELDCTPSPVDFNLELRVANITENSVFRRGSGGIEIIETVNDKFYRCDVDGTSLVFPSKLIDSLTSADSSDTFTYDDLVKQMTDSAKAAGSHNEAVRILARLRLIDICPDC